MLPNRILDWRLGGESSKETRGGQRIKIWERKMETQTVLVQRGGTFKVETTFYIAREREVVRLPPQYHQS